MAWVRNKKTGDVKQVKNLGWLLNHAAQVTVIRVQAYGPKSFVQAEVRAQLGDDLEFGMHVPSFDVAVRFAFRRRFDKAKKVVKP